jgi:hypothetical protein
MRVGNDRTIFPLQPRCQSFGSVPIWKRMPISSFAEAETIHESKRSNTNINLLRVNSCESWIVRLDGSEHSFTAD